MVAAWRWCHFSWIPNVQIIILKGVSLLDGVDLLDGFLVERIGGVSDTTLESILSVCEDAATAVVGCEIGRAVLRDPPLTERMLGWIWDLARGLHYQSIYGSDMPSTRELIERLGPPYLDMDIRAIIADRVDWAFILIEDRLAEHVQGRNAIKLSGVERERTFPWYDRLKLGYRIRLTTEALRLASAP
jgi:hypothetical protein